MSLRSASLLMDLLRIFASTVYGMGLNWAKFRYLKMLIGRNIRTYAPD